MKKSRLAIVALLVALGASNAHGQSYSVSDYAGTNDNGTLRKALSNLSSTGSGSGNTITFSNGLGEIALSNDLTEINKGVSFLSDYSVQIRSSSLTGKSLFTLGNDSPSISISPNLDLYAQGQNNVKAIFGKRSINILSGLGGDYEAQTQLGNGAYGILANGDARWTSTGIFSGYWTYHSGNISIGLLSDDGLSGSVTATSAASHAYGLRAGGPTEYGILTNFRVAGDIAVYGDLSGEVSATAVDDHAYGLYAQGGRGSANGSITIDGDLSGSVTATATEGNYAYGLYARGTSLDLSRDILSGNGIKTGTLSLGALSGKVTVTAAGSDAYGLKAGELGVSPGEYDGLDDLLGLVNYAPGNIFIGSSGNGGDLSGIIDVEATGGSNAYGLYAAGDITIYGSFTEGNFNVTLNGEGEGSASEGGLVTVRAGQDHAYGMYASGDIVTGGDFAGTMDVEAGGSNAYGLKAGEAIFVNNLPVSVLEGDIIVGDHASLTGDFSGKVSVDAATGSNAFGLFASNDIIVGGSFLGTGVPDLAKVSVMDSGYPDIDISAAGNFVMGITALNNIEVGVDFANTVSVSAGGNVASGIFAGNNINVGNDFSASVSSTAGGDVATGVFAGDDIEVGNDLSATVRADAGGNVATGILALGNIETGGDLSGKIVTKAGGNAALGMSSGNDVLIGNDLSGKIITKAGGTGASGILALNNIEIGNDLSGKVITIADGNLAAGLSAGGDIEIAGELSGKVISIAKGEGTGFDFFGIGAFGLGALGGIYGATPDESLDISGTVLAKANIGAAGIVAFGPMNLDITGTVAGIDTFIDGENLGFSVLSGSLLTSNNVTDKVTVREYGELIGSVNLGAGDDEMTVEDQAIISSVPMLNGGTTLDFQNSENDVLTFDGWTGTLGDVVINWETIDVLNNSDVDLGKSKVIITLADGLQEYEAQLLQPVNMTIDETSAVRAKGNSPGLYGLVGNLTNKGLFDQMDDEVNDVMALIDYSGSGNDAFYYLDADLSTSGKISTEGLIVAGDVSGKTKVMLNNVDSHVAVTEGDGILFAAVAGSSQNDAFVLENPNDFGPFAVDIARGTSSLTDESWFIVSPGYREEAAVLQAVTPFIERLGYESIMKFHERRAYGWFRYDEGEQEAYWVRMTGSKYRLGMEGDAASELEGYTGWFQIGADLYADGNEDTRFNIGVFAGAGYGEADVAGLRSDKAGELSQTAYGIGAYMTLHQRGAWYLDAVAQAIYNDLSIDYLTEAKQKPDAWSWLASIETGGCIGLGDSFRLQPQAQLVYQHTDGIDLQTLVGEVNIEDHEGLQGRLSLTGIAGACKDDTNPFFEVTLIRDFSESGKVVYQGNAELDPSFDHEAVELSSNPERWFLGGAVGLSREVSEKNALGYYIKLGALYGMDSLDSYSYSLMAGLRKTF
ncbi:MAG: autotransporter domain-containing protein [Chlorobi bacterium]|nr:autotransporter domain-containing protein [Chlorobiota bacterium]